MVYLWRAFALLLFVWSISAFVSLFWSDELNRTTLSRVLLATAVLPPKRCRPPIEHPVRTNKIPRQIPPQSFYTQFFPGVAMGGILPFGCVFIQLFFILNSIWGHKLYYVFGFLLLVFLILLITVVESTILLCYFHLCAEEYRWWWRAFLTVGDAHPHPHPHPLILILILATSPSPIPIPIAHRSSLIIV
jgi:hypothetical protein